MRRCSTGRTGRGHHPQGGVRREPEAGGRVPLLWQHKAGRGDRADRASVRGQARAARDRASWARARMRRRAARLLQSGKLDGLSFGYRVREAAKAGGLRELIELDLVEVSLVAKPMQPHGAGACGRMKLHFCADHDDGCDVSLVVVAAAPGGLVMLPVRRPACRDVRDRRSKRRLDCRFSAFGPCFAGDA